MDIVLVNCFGLVLPSTLCKTRCRYTTKSSTKDIDLIALLKQWRKDDAKAEEEREKRAKEERKKTQKFQLNMMKVIMGHQPDADSDDD